MSVPVRYSAAAEYAVVDSGLENTLTQEEQYHQQQQQLQQHQQQQQLQQLHQQQQQLEQQQQYEAQYEQYEQQYQQEQEQAHLLYCQLQQQLEAEVQAVRQQQQRTSMSLSSGMPALLDLPLNNNNNNNANVATNLNNNNNAMDAISINAILVDDEQPSTSAQAAAAAAAALLVGKSVNGIGDATEMSTDWMRIANEGRYGTPGAAGLEYQKYEQQQQTATLDTEAGNGATGGGASEPSSALKILEEKLHALSSDELYETLKEYDALQDKYHTVLLLPKESRVSCD